MTTLPKLVTVDLAQSKLTIDGEDFPWYIPLDEPIRVALSPEPGDVHKVSVTFIAENVSVIPGGDDRGE